MTTFLECAAMLRQKAVCKPWEALPLFEGRIGRTALYESIRSGQFYVQPLRIGTRIFLPVKPLLEALGLFEDAPGEEEEALLPSDTETEQVPG